MRTENKDFIPPLRQTGVSRSAFDIRIVNNRLGISGKNIQFGLAPY